MPPVVRSAHPVCPACGFAVFNRRCATCEKCGAVLPPSIAYTPAELATLQEKDRVDEAVHARRMEKYRAERARRIARTSGGADGTGDLSDLLDFCGD